MRGLWGHLACFAIASALGACSGSKGNGNGPPGPAHKQVSLYFTTELRGTIEPCGCTSDPMGDLARTVKLVADARASGSGVLFFDGGSTLYSAPKLDPKQKAAERMKAELLVKALRADLRAAAVGLGPYDLAGGVASLQPPRHAVNLAGDAGVPLAQPEVIEAGGVEVGVFGVVSPVAMKGSGIDAGDPVEAARAAVARLRGAGAEIVVALAHMTRREAAALARKTKGPDGGAGIDLLLVGLNAPEPPLVRDAPTRVGDTWLFRPANRGQTVVKIDVSLRGKGPLADALGPARARAEIQRLDARIEGQRKELASFEKDPEADPAFVARKKKELAELEAERKRLSAEPLRIPERGSWFVFEQIRIKKRLPCDPQLVAAKQAYDRAAGKANAAAAKAMKPPAPAKGKAGYSGVEECGFCHSAAVKFWKTTKHHEAWETLEKLGKQLSYDCIGCHVTGWDQPGGSTLAHNQPLRDVQCETCHGPGSLHVDADGQDKPRTVIRNPPETLCKQCHSPDHSDTFDYTAYLRDVTGPGHGEAFRKKLGDGPTGGQLRKAALEKAGEAIGSGCPK